jgi:4-hydroxy 2-oxovalerate aldolase
MKKLLNQINLLDCTLRDGGYYNNWNFSKELVNFYLKSISKSGIKYVELGFRSLKKNNFKGPNWYTTDEYIKSLKIPKNINLGVMVNAVEILSSSQGIKKAVNALFKNITNSKLKFVRLACHSDEFEKTTEISKYIQSKGYLVGINLMQITELSKKRIQEISKFASKKRPDFLYFADSLGRLSNSEVQEIVADIKNYWSGALGIHAHDNTERALQNSIKAIQSGANWVDSTVLGMGRGPGNAKTEHLILELNNYLKKNTFNVLPLARLIEKYFFDLKNKYKWGTNPFYFISGIHGIHPTYVQEMLSIKLDYFEMLEAINNLKNNNGNKYNVNLVRSDFQKPIKITSGTWKPKNEFNNKEVLLISSGKSTSEYKKEIENYILKNKPKVIALNTFTNINKKLIDYYLACNPLRILADADLYSKIKSPLIIPKSLVSPEIKKKLKKVKLLDFGIGLKNNKFKFYNTSALIPKLYNVAYALSVVTSGRASKIFLAGFDGYDFGDTRNKIIDEIFFEYLSNNNSKPVISITPTKYSVSNISIYAI